MNEAELATLTAELPEKFANRVSESTLRVLRSLAGAGEWGEELDLLVAGLKKTGARVSTEEVDQLRTLFAGWQIPSDILDGLNMAD